MNNPGKILEPWGGYLIDISKVLRMDLKNPHSIWKFKKIVSLQRRHSAASLLETGTYLGVTTARCAKHFSYIETIELDDDLYQRAREYLSRFSHINVVHGDSLASLPQSIQNCISKGPVVIFLDGHFSGGATAIGDHAEPACLEIEAMQPFLSGISGVIVDDFRLFGKQEGYPKKSELLATVERVFDENDFRIYIEADQLVVERNEECRF